MNRQEHLLIILAEECVEVAHEVTKALRFGLDDYWKDGETNRIKISQELADLFGIYRMLINEKIIEEAQFSKIIDKDQKVEKFLLYSKEKGTLTDTDELEVLPLTKEKIEAEGWVSETLGDGSIPGFVKGNYMMAFNEKIYFISIMPIDPIKWKFINIVSEWCLYQGECKLLNEFRYICKLLKI